MTTVANNTGQANMGSVVPVICNIHSAVRICGVAALSVLMAVTVFIPNKAATMAIPSRLPTSSVAKRMPISINSCQPGWIVAPPRMFRCGGKFIIPLKMRIFAAKIRHAGTNWKY